MSRRRIPGAKDSKTMKTPRITTTLASTTLVLLVALPTTAIAGDLDGDGRDDLIVGVPRLDDGSSAAVGGAAIYEGSATGLVADDMLLPLADAGARAGKAVAIGDFDCDGHDDVALGSPLDNANSIDASGSVFVYINDGSGGWEPELELTRQSFGPEPQETDHFGRALVAGDFDGDQCDDLAIGAPRASASTGVRSGLVYVGFGSSAGLVLDASGARNRPLAQGEDQTDARYGFSLAAGDFTGDGADELIIGAPTFRDANDDQVGEVIVLEFIGGSSGFDPYGSYIYGEVTDDTNGDVTEPWFGWSMSVGDFDDDGTNDLAIGAPGYQTPHYAGRVDLYLAVGQQTTVDQTLAGDAPNDRFGTALAAGDINGDGADDLAIGAIFATAVNGPSQSGLVELYAGDAGVGICSLLATLSPMQHGHHATSQKFGSSIAMGSYRGAGLDIAVGAKRAKNGGYRNGGVFMFDNNAGLLSSGNFLGLADFGINQNGALFGESVSQ